METEERYQEIWKYKAEDSHVQIHETTHLIGWANGLSIATFNQEGSPLEIKTFLGKKSWDSSLFKDLFHEEPLLKKTKLVKKIWWAEERNIIVPEQLYVKNYAEKWIRRFHFLETSENLHDYYLQPYLNAQMVFPIAEEIQKLIESNFPEASIDALSKIALSLPSESRTTCIKITNLPKIVLLSLQENSRNIYHQIAAYENIQDIIYKIAIILQEKDLNQNQVEIEIQGIAPFYNNILDELKNFFVIKNTITNTTLETLNFFKTLYKCAL